MALGWLVKSRDNEDGCKRDVEWWLVNYQLGCDIVSSKVNPLGLHEVASPNLAGTMWLQPGGQVDGLLSGNVVCSENSM